MGPLARTGLAGALACGVLVTAVGIGRDLTGSGGDGGRPSKGPYVALGDSFTSGPRIPDQTGKPAGCERSSRNYPALVAKQLGIRAADFRDASCSAATIGNLTGPQSTNDGTNPAQFSALTAATALVTLGIGGNDIGFSIMVAKCVTTGELYKAAAKVTNINGQAPCKERYAPGDGAEVARKIRTAGDHLARALNDVKHRAPKARIYLVGYPAILPAKGAGCGSDMPLAPGDVTFLRETERQLNAMLRERAEAAGATYVDTFTPSIGHDACSTAATRWIEPLRPSSPAAAVHPNERGERGMAAAVLRAVGP
ncbi:SGNH/GDSL hydrolase family protein [Streptomyces sp. NPDC001435]|uniref:SGNH/GDSL hydrolase family protein n=1 Tax=Streptomyces sp. NPDC001435 TaxID=3364576 RepID=UPI003696D909